jgi:hypothetical protein
VTSRAITAALLLATLASLPSCAIFDNKGPDPPRVNKIVDRTRARAERMREVQSLMTQDLAQIQQLQQEIFSVDPNRWLQPFPLSLFRFVAMSCLNERLMLDEEREPDDPPRLAIQARYDVALGCSPTSLPELWAAVSADEAQARFMVVQLARIDRVRALRARLYKRLNLLPQLIREEQAKMAELRAEWRRVDAEIKRNRSAYRGESLTTAQRRLNVLDAELLELGESIIALSSAQSQWPQLLQRHISALTMELTALSVRRVDAALQLD